MTNLVPTRWNRSLDDLHNRMSRLFHDVSSLVGRDEPEWTLSPFQAPFTMPSVEVEETDAHVIVRAEMPGLEKDDFNIQLENDTVVLRGEKKQRQENQDANVHRIETAYGQFHRRIPLPVEVDHDQAEAEYKNGVLTLELPKSQNARRKSIAVKVT